MKIDFGSGYNPKTGFLSCDFTGSPILDLYSKDYKIFKNIDEEIANSSVDEFYCRNVIHHIKDLNKLFNMFYKYLNNGGILNIIDCRKEFYSQNVFFDKLWYRYIIPRPEIWFSEIYRNYIKIALDSGFILLKSNYKNEKEMFILKK